MQAAAIAAVPPPPAQQAVTSYLPAFFAAQNPASALDMIGRIPGFNLDTGSTVRGFEGAAGNVLIDGQRPSSKADSVDQVLQRIPASRVQRIDVIRGGAPGIDMQGKTVIANVIQETGGGARGLLAVGNFHTGDDREFPTLRAEASGRLGDGAWEASLRFATSPDDGASTGRGVVIFADGRPTQASLLDAKGQENADIATGAFETPLLGGRLRLNSRLAHEVFTEPELDRVTAPRLEIRTFGFRQRTDDTELGGRFSRDIRTATSLELVVLRTTRDRDVDSTSSTADGLTDFLSSRGGSEVIVRGVVKHRFTEQFSAEAGAETADNKLDSRTRLAIDAVNQILPAANVRVKEKRREIFAKATWRPNARWTLDGAIRYESSDISSAGDVILAKSLQYAKPRLAVAWTPTPATQLRLRVEREVGQLDFNAFVASSNLSNGLGVTAGNPNLNPELDWVAEAAIEQQLWKGASLVLTARHFRITDVIDRGPVFAADGAVFDRPTNIGSGSRDALILDFTLPFDTFGWKGALLKGQVLRRWTEVTDPTTGQKRAISFTRPNEWNASFSQDLPRQNLNLGVDVYGGFQQTAYRFNLIETLKLQTYVRPYIEWKPKPDLSLRLELPLVTAPEVRLRNTLQIYPGPRSAGGKPDIQDRQFHFPRGIYIRFRKDFGA